MNPGPSESPAAGAEYLGLMRHAESWYPGMDADKRSVEHPALTKDGAGAVAGVARRLLEVLTDLRIDSVAIHHVGTEQSEQTAVALSAALGRTSFASESEVIRSLSPDSIPACGQTDIAQALARAWAAARGALASPKGLHVIVGHDPQISWLFAELVRENWAIGLWRPPLAPLSTGELVLVQGESALDALIRKEAPLSSSGVERPRFVFAPSDPKATEALLAKIDSKMKSAGLFGAFLVGVLMWAAGDILSVAPQSAVSAVLEFVGFGFLGLAVALYFITLFAYDRLLMPPKFWGTAAKRRRSRFDRGLVLRPPASNVRVLYEGMMLVWRMAFIPATVTGGIGVGTLLAAQVRPEWWWLSVLLATAIWIIAYLAHVLSRIPLGVND